MSSRIELHAARRSRLIARSERLRHSVQADAAGLAGRFRFADQIVAVSRTGVFKLVLGGAVALLLTRRGGRLVGLVSRAAMLYPLLRRALRLVAGPPKDASPQP
jgi:hypothetical protein